MSTCVVKEWTTSCGLEASIVRNKSLDIFLGYVSVPPHYPAYSTLQDSFQATEEPHFIDVHGGVTCFNKEAETMNFIVGFDCGHAFDNTKLWGGVVRDENFVFIECEMMAYQLVHMDFDPKSHQSW
jgi:hypothetical protein